MSNIHIFIIRSRVNHFLSGTLYQNILKLRPALGIPAMLENYISTTIRSTNRETGVKCLTQGHSYVAIVSGERMIDNAEGSGSNH